MDSSGRKIFHRSLGLGYEETKKELTTFDVYNMLCFDDFDSQYEMLLAVSNYYEREYDTFQAKSDDGLEFWQKLIYCALKSLLHLQPIRLADMNVIIPQELKCANEHYCWNVFFQMYVEFIAQLRGKRRAYPACCTAHFVGVKKSFIDVLFNSRNRLSDITPSYIRLVSDILLQKHENISADRIRILLNKSGFITFINYWAKEQSQVGLIFCDIDKFKQVNDCNDHTIGDMVLNDIAATLESVGKQNNGIAARIGGEEFWVAVCNPKTSLTAISDEIKAALMNVARPNPEEKALSEGIYFSYMTLTSAGGMLPKPRGSDKDSLDEWMYKLENKWMDRLDKVVIASKKRNRRNCFYEVDLVYD
ncbi:MAG: diguanylate cyclase [Defluviitaleaceae bacterium]|nr:diguanylate cyclase [Defluviitaleaceae bacterium]